MASEPIGPAKNNDPQYIFTSVFDASGNPIFRTTAAPGLQAPNLGGAGGGDDVVSLWKLDVRRDVQIAKWGLALLVGAFGVAFLFFIGEFKDVRKDISSIQISQSGQAATTSGIQATLSRIEDKVEGGKNGDAIPSARPAVKKR